VFFDSSYTAEYLTTHRDLLSARGTGCFCFLFSLFFCLHVNSGALIPEGAQLTVRGGGFLLSRVLLLVILLVVYVFVVYI
jgi:hypothetical protein